MPWKKRNEKQYLLTALKDLTEYCTSGRRYETRNPYAIPEIIAALKTIAFVQGQDPANDWMDANKDHLGG